MYGKLSSLNVRQESLLINRLFLTKTLTLQTYSNVHLKIIVVIYIMGELCLFMINLVFLDESFRITYLSLLKIPSLFVCTGKNTLHQFLVRWPKRWKKVKANAWYRQQVCYLCSFSCFPPWRTLAQLLFFSNPNIQSLGSTSQYLRVYCTTQNLSVSVPFSANILPPVHQPPLPPSQGLVIRGWRAASECIV